jgi:hypothetical protein
MGKHSIGSPVSSNPRSVSGLETRAVQQKSNEAATDRDSARKEMIASMVREWVVPALVRKFRSERTPKEPVGAGDVLDAFR